MPIFSLVPVVVDIKNAEWFDHNHYNDFISYHLKRDGTFKDVRDEWYENQYAQIWSFGDLFELDDMFRVAIYTAWLVSNSDDYDLDKNVFNHIFDKDTLKGGDYDKVRSILKTWLDFVIKSHN